MKKLIIAAVSLAAATLASAAAEAQTVVSPQVVHTGTAPTGYEVTFRIADPTAARMRIKGEWYFTSEAESSFSPPTSAARLPSQWRPGDFALGSPNATDPNWPVADMVKGADGVWTYTTPLPSGWFTYQLFKDCNAAPPSLAGCTPMQDPSNPPWGRTSNSVAPNSQVYVPSDPVFGTEDLSWQAPAPTGQRGTLTARDYPSPQSTAPVGSHDLVVYTPPGYDPNRATPYPLFVLSHGGGENGVAWTSQGAAQHIVDNLIAAGTIQPLVIVMTNATGIPGGTAGYAADLRNSVFPFMEANYNVSKVPSGRAYAGQSAGGNRGNELLLNNTTLLGYHGIWSCCNVAGAIRPVGDPIYNKPELKQVLGLQIAIGKQDPVRSFANTEMAGLTAAGVPFTTYLTNGGHEWQFWRKALREYLTAFAFRTTKTSVVPGAGSVQVTVQSATAEPITPTGTVTAGGVTVPLVNGSATIPVRSAAGAIAVTYSGDQYYNASSGSATYAASSVDGTVGGSVPATLSLTLGLPASLGAFVPGRDATYTAQTTANVVSSAGDAALSVSEPGRLANGAFTLLEPLQVTLSKRTWSTPVSNDPVTVGFSQHISANEPLRTGNYSRTLTFTLSTTTP
ncbi:alpha/beta hydrolase-fold protein [Solirubrobacter taibaiensis]|nr:alpha/beta hydrolase-fold protein [Solirubrobacter taibaiensis]